MLLYEYIFLLSTYFIYLSLEVNLLFPLFHFWHFSNMTLDTSEYSLISLSTFSYSILVSLHLNLIFNCSLYCIQYYCISLCLSVFPRLWSEFHQIAFWAPFISCCTYLTHSLPDLRDIHNNEIDFSKIFKKVLVCIL